MFFILYRVFFFEKEEGISKKKPHFWGNGGFFLESPYLRGDEDKSKKERV